MIKLLSAYLNGVAIVMVVVGMMVQVLVMTAAVVGVVMTVVVVRVVMGMRAVVKRLFCHW